MSDTITATPKTRRRMPRLLGLLLAVLLILANGAFAVVVMAELRAADARVERTLQAMVALNNIESLAEGAGRNQRTYRASGGPEYLAAYRRMELELPEALSGLRRLMIDDNDWTPQLKHLRTLIGEDAAALAASATPVQMGAGAGSLPPELAASQDRTLAIVSAIDGTLDSERKLLSAHLAVINSRGTVVLGTVLLATLGSVALIGVIFLLMRRDVRQTEQLAEATSGAMQESELRFRSVFEESPVGKLLALSGNLRIVRANPSVCRMLGYEADEMVGKSLLDMVHVDDRDLLIDALNRANIPGHVIEARYLTCSGTIAWARVRLTRLSTSDGREPLLLAMITDITREIQAEGELRQAQKMQAIGELTGGLAHDFNNLLGVIIGNVEFLLDALRGRSDETELATDILNSALSGADLTRRLLAVARRQALQPRRIDLNAYLPNHIAMLRRVLGATTRITTSFDSGLWPTRADPSQVGDALLNLAINARDAMPHGGSVAIEAANTHVDSGMAADDGDMAAGDYIVLSVTDTGIGMAPELLKRVVEPFFTTKALGAGSGLGLSMIYGFARQSGGYLRLQSEPGHGTTVRLFLPRAGGEEEDDSEFADDPSLPGGYESILLVDDNAEMRAVGRRHLASLGYRVTEADSGSAALALLQGQEHFDLLFTDIVMPHDMTGYQLAAAARLLQPGLKVLFTTGYAGPGTRVEPPGPPTGATIRKPYLRQELAITTRTALET
jgi:PAS domain S-box-containing protein